MTLQGSRAKSSFFTFFCVLSVTELERYLLDTNVLVIARFEPVTLTMRLPHQPLELPLGPNIECIA